MQIQSVRLFLKDLNLAIGPYLLRLLLLLDVLLSLALYLKAKSSNNNSFCMNFNKLQIGFI